MPGVPKGGYSVGLLGAKTEIPVQIRRLTTNLIDIGAVPNNEIAIDHKIRLFIYAGDAQREGAPLITLRITLFEIWTLVDWSICHPYAILCARKVYREQLEM